MPSANHTVLEALSHVNYGAHDRSVIGIASDPSDKGLVNFSGHQWETAER